VLLCKKDIFNGGEKSVVFLYILLLLSMVSSVLPQGKKDILPLVFWGAALVLAVCLLVSNATTPVRINI
jgi:uncharacterized BrkB/YihY/UPF0761 family membrane protein